MKSILIDSDILIEVSRGRDRAILEIWNKLGRSEVVPCCSPVTIAEVWHGARPSEHEVIGALFQALQCIPIDDAIGQKAGEYLRGYAKSHALELGDALIAATVSMHNLELWTRNRRHYPMKHLAFY